MSKRPNYDIRINAAAMSWHGISGIGCQPGFVGYNFIIYLYYIYNHMVCQ
jgi:hypothetical protein